MITVKVYQRDKRCYGFESSGHAEYAEEGYDIVCAAVSVLTINTINSIEEFTDDDMVVEQGQDGGYLKLELSGDVSDQTELLLESLVLGLKTIKETYGEQFLTVQTVEQQN